MEMQFVLFFLGGIAEDGSKSDPRPGAQKAVAGFASRHSFFAFAPSWAFDGLLDIDHAVHFANQAVPFSSRRIRSHCLQFMRDRRHRRFRDV
jgi:hypothetical protein